MSDKPTGIRVNQITANRIKFLNKSNSYEENIVACLDYFDRTGVNPFLLKEHPIEVTMKGFDRTIAVLKGVEKSNLKKFIDIENLLKPLAEWVQKGFPNHVENSVSIGNDEDQISEEELQAIVNLNQSLTTKVDELEKEIKLKNMEIFNLINSETSNNSNEVNLIKGHISDLTKRLEESVKKSNFGNDYSIKYSDLSFIIQSLKNLDL